MRKLSDSDFLAHLKTRSDLVSKAVPLLKERARTFSEARELLSGELSCLFEEPILDRDRLVAKELPGHPEMTKTALKSLLEPLKALLNDVSAEAVKEVIMPFADAEEAKGLSAQAGKGGRGAVLWPLRYALSGQERSPDPFTLISILGPEESISRVEKAIAILEG